MRLRAAMVALATSFVTLLSLAVSPAPASAAAYSRTVYAPVAAGSSVEGWANINANCEGTFGCFTYIKVERLNSPSLPVRHWQYWGGQWAGEGWNRASASIRECGYFRTVVDAYNDAPSNSAAGISLGVVEVTLGGGVKRYHQTFVSATSYVCPLA